MSDLSGLLKSLSEELPEALKHAILTVSDLRAQVGVGELDGSPADLHKQLVKNRQAMDRTETFMAQLARLHTRAQIAEQDLAAELEDAEAQAVKKAGAVEEYSTAKERNARLNLHTIDQKIALRKATRQRAEISEALEYVRTLYRGMEGSRRDVETRLRMITLEGGLDR
jgi:hypothetical protein